MLYKCPGPSASLLFCLSGPPSFCILNSYAFRMSNFGASSRYEKGQVLHHLHLKAPSLPLQHHLQPQLTASPGFSFGQLRGAPGNGPGFASGVGRTTSQTPVTLSPEKTVNRKFSPVYKTNGSRRTRGTDAPKHRHLGSSRSQAAFGIRYGKITLHGKTGTLMSQVCSLPRAH